MKRKNIILFHSGLTGAGGAERLMFEEEKYFRYNNYDTMILTFDFDIKSLFNNHFNPKIKNLNIKYGKNNRLKTFLRRVFTLRNILKEINPNMILSSNMWDCIYLYFATFGTNIRYSSHIHSTIFWFGDDLTKYSFIYQKVFNEVREGVYGHRQYLSKNPPKIQFKKRLFYEILALCMYLGVKKAKKLFVLSRRMKWEIKKIYKRKAIIVKGAYPKEILYYKPKKSVLKKYNLPNKTFILNINRLDTRKRIDLIIRSFAKITDKFKNVILVIGGTGEDEKRLKNIVEELKLQKKVIFIGYVKEEDLWDLIGCCEVFAHPNWAEYVIAPMEALALQKKVLLTTEMEIDKNFQKNIHHIFLSDPEVDKFSETMKKSLFAKPKEKNDMSMYTWELYCKKIEQYLFSLNLS